MITTLSQDAEGWKLGITIDDDGSVAVTLGPTENKNQILRWERHVLRSYREWTEVLRSGEPARWHLLHARTIKETIIFKESYHDVWMRHRPLHEVTPEPLKLGTKMRIIYMHEGEDSADDL